ncbi:A disintegrin and metalloproteinase with thrombospondin motifs like isoform X2 [Lepeophtheirus salmonis]|uniref:A disintegrin and metalloproteinase with thrombospondin motifs like isoform X2 n=1 Tax=Lepeophtheirus salmonis TaxID=72036 RepID=UPI001AE20BE7|nr:A disintegrin and metalloproteinase with thrombospondin motifs 6-like isoform X2 [Lepeophtheirus salmonis]
MRFSRKSYPIIPNTFLFFLVLGTSTSSLLHVQASQTEASSHHHAHMSMSKQELRRIFQVEHHDDVPRYEVIKIHSVIRRRRRRRSSDDDDFDEIVHRVNLRTHGQDFNLELQRNQHLLKKSFNGSNFWFADSPVGDDGNRDANISYTPHFGNEDEEEIGFPYQDPKNRAAVLLFKDKTENAFLMDGMISEDLVVKPITPDMRDRLSIPRSPRFLPFPEEEDETEEEIRSPRVISSNRLLHDDYAFLDEDEDIEDEDVMVQRNKRSSEENEIRFNSGYHIIFKRKNVGEDHSSDYHHMENEEKSAFTQIDERVVKERIHSRNKRQAPYIIFPEILCIVDYDGYRLHGKDNIAIKRYVISFWNGIDLRYKLLKSPSVKISIAGIIISRGRDATPYLERNRVGKDAIDSAAALTDMGKYLFLERRLPVYDIAVAITKLDMCRKKSQYGGDCNRGTAGFAYVGGACVVNKKLEKVNSVAIVEDTGGFSGIIVAAHELGHLLGAVHDGSPPPLYLGGPGARKCRWSDGFIMSDLRHTSKGFRWSRCSVKQFHHFLNGETATCMYNSPHSDESLPRVLPGKLLSLDAQCRKDRGTSACFKDDRVCAQLFCFDAGSGYCVSYRPAAEGSRCGDGKMCLNGKCVNEHENAVDFDSDGFVRRSGTVDFEEAPSHQSTDLGRYFRHMRRSY